MRIILAASPVLLCILKQGLVDSVLLHAMTAVLILLLQCQFAPLDTALIGKRNNDNFVRVMSK